MQFKDNSTLIKRDNLLHTQHVLVAKVTDITAHLTRDKKYDDVTSGIEQDFTLQLCFLPQQLYTSRLRRVIITFFFHAQ